MFVFASQECPVSNRYREELKRIEAAYPNVRFIKTESRDLARRYGVTVTPEVAVVDESDRLLYRGRIDDQYAGYGKTRLVPRRRDLRTALDEILAGKPVSLPRTKAFGCALTDTTNAPSASR